MMAGRTGVPRCGSREGRATWEGRASPEAQGVRFGLARIREPFPSLPDAVHVSSGSFPLRSLLPEASSCVGQEEPQQGSEGRRSPRKGHWHRPLSVGLPRAAVFLDGSCSSSPGSANHLQVAPFARSGVDGVRAPLCSCWGSTKS